MDRVFFQDKATHRLSINRTWTASKNNGTAAAIPSVERSP